MKRISICEDWHFSPLWSESFAQGQTQGEAVCLPHAVSLLWDDAQAVPLPMTCGYRRALALPAEWENGRVFVRFDGIAGEAQLFVNGQPAGRQDCPGIAFAAEITALVHFGTENVLALRVSAGGEKAADPAAAALGLYMGLNRSAWLEGTPSQARAAALVVQTPAPAQADLAITLEHPEEIAAVQAELLSPAGSRLFLRVLTGRQIEPELLLHECAAPGAPAWTPESPALCTARVRLLGRHGELLDEETQRFGFRRVRFRDDGFFLSGRRQKLIGLNRVEYWPEAGTALPAALQRFDAEILKNELHVNAVRTPGCVPAPEFLDACDELGLLVLPELPARALRTPETADAALRGMILQNAAHPCIAAWGIPVPRGTGASPLQQQLAKRAHELDLTRQTVGICAGGQEPLPEDVYAFEDYADGRRAAPPRSAVTPRGTRCYLLAAHSAVPGADAAAEGPLPQALRHAAALDAVFAQENCAGAFGSYFADFPAGAFGGGGAVCRCGVLDAWRNPRLAAAVYASQSDAAPCLVLSGAPDGGLPAGEGVWAFTNAQALRVYRSGVRLPSGKVEIASPQPAGLRLHRALCGFWHGIPHREWQRLYEEYAAPRPARAPEICVEALRGDAFAERAVCGPAAGLHLEASASSLSLCGAAGAAAVRLRLADANGRTAGGFERPVTLEVSGPLTLAGPRQICLQDGQGGALLMAAGGTGEACLTVTMPGARSAQLRFAVQAGAQDAAVQA